jgi:hypothetical protein
MVHQAAAEAQRLLDGGGTSGEIRARSRVPTYGTASWSGVSVSSERLRQRGLWRGTARSYDENKVDRLHIEKQNRAFRDNIGPDSNRAAHCVPNESPVAGSRDCPLMRPTM